jgi:hypothetical protein
MYCKECGKIIDDDSKFCSYCGTKQSISLTTENITRNQKESNDPHKQVIDNSLSFGKPIKREITESTKIEKYDRSYQGDSQATVVGVVLIIINLIILLTINIEDPYDLQVYKAIAALINTIWRIIATIWVVNIAKRQNREQALWGLFAFLIPNLALIIIGLLKKLKLSSGNTSGTIQDGNQIKGGLSEISLTITQSNNVDDLKYSIIDTIQKKSFFQTRNELVIQFFDNLKGSIFTFDSSIFFIVQNDNTQYHYRKKDSAVKALYLYLTEKKTLMEDLAFSS